MFTIPWNHPPDNRTLKKKRERKNIIDKKHFGRLKLHWEKCRKVNIIYMYIKQRKGDLCFWKLPFPSSSMGRCLQRLKRRIRQGRRKRRRRERRIKNVYFYSPQNDKVFMSLSPPFLKFAPRPPIETTTNEVEDFLQKIP